MKPANKKIKGNIFIWFFSWDRSDTVTQVDLDFTRKPRLASNMGRDSCHRLLSTSITVMTYHAWIAQLLKNKNRLLKVYHFISELKMPEETCLVCEYIFKSGRLIRGKKKFFKNCTKTMGRIINAFYTNYTLNSHHSTV